jgi:hypothetical protein
MIARRTPPSNQSRTAGRIVLAGFRACSASQGRTMASTGQHVRLVILGDIHGSFCLERDQQALRVLKPDMTLFLGDFGNEVGHTACCLQGCGLAALCHAWGSFCKELSITTLQFSLLVNNRMSGLLSRCAL